MHPTVSLNFGPFLRQLRQRAGMTQADLAAAAGYSASFISNLEKEARLPDLESVVQRFIPALALQDDPKLAARLVELAAAARGMRPPTSFTIARDTQWVTVTETATGHLPAPPTPLIGRAAEVERVCKRLLGHHGRLLTLTGPPGVGKTRLALAVATQLQPIYAEGACFVSLAGIEDPGFCAPAILAALGVGEINAKTPEARLLAHLADQELLLVLDNFEQILPAAPFLAQLLAAAPRLRLLATSRERLHIRAEQRYQVEALPLADAIHLFVQAAHAADPAFAPQPTDQPLLADICRALDCLPLALELAAAQLEFADLSSLRARLRSQRLDVLEGGARDLPERQRTLRTAIAHSYDRLQPAEQLLFRRLGVFAGGFDLAALHDLGLAAGAFHTLIAKNLVQREETSGEEARFHLLETLRAYALEKLAAHGEATAASQVHAAYFLSLAERSQAQFDTPEREEWLHRLDREADNLRAAMRFLRHDTPEQAQRLAAALREYWNLRGFYTEGRRWTQQALAGSPAVTRARAGALLTATQLAIAQSDYTEAAELAEAALQAFRTLGDARGEALALHLAGSCARGQQRLQPALAYVQESLRMFRSLDDKAQVALALATQLHIMTLLGATPEAMRPVFQETADCFIALGRQDELAHVSVRRGTMEMLAGNYAEARTLLGASVALFRKLGNQRELAWALEELGEACWLLGDHTAAQQNFAEAHALFQMMGETLGVEILLHHFGQMEAAWGEFYKAEYSFQQSLRLSWGREDARMIARNLAGLGGVALARQQSARAVELLIAAEHLFAALPSFLSPADRAHYDALLAAVRAQIGAEAYAAADAAGRERPIAAVIAQALADSPPD